MPKNSGWISGKVKLSFRGEPLEFEMTVPAGSVKPTRVLPVLQNITDTFTDLGVKRAEADGKKVSCQKGCAACCRQAIPVAEIEAYRIVELVEKMPEPRRSRVKERFDTACRHFHQTGWFERLENSVGLSNENQNGILMEYFDEWIDCPFLEDEACLIHPERPLACREYLVTSPAENCWHPKAETVKMVELPVKPSKIVRQIGRSKNLKNINFLPLIRALEYAGQYPEKMPKKSGEQWMAEFFRILTGSEIPSR